MNLPKLNKRGEEEISEAILDIPRIVFLLFVLVVLTLPIGCYSKNKQAQLDKVNEFESGLFFIEAKNCLEKGISEKSFKECFIKENVGLKVTSPDASFTYNPDKFEEELCNLGKTVKCKKETVIIKENEKIRQVFIEMVVNYE